MENNDNLSERNRNSGPCSNQVLFKYKYTDLEIGLNTSVRSGVVLGISVFDFHTKICSRF